MDDSKLGEAVRPYVERKMMGKYVHKHNNNNDMKKTFSEASGLTG